MDMEIITNAATTALTNVALAALSLLAAWAVYYLRLGSGKLKEQTAQLKDAGARETLERALEDVERLAELTVGYTEQTTAKALRLAVKRGLKDREELLALGREVFAEVKGRIAPEAQRVITENLGSFDRYLEDCIENAVLKVKQSDPFLALPEGVMVEGVVANAAEAPTQ